MTPTEEQLLPKSERMSADMLEQAEADAVAEMTSDEVRRLIFKDAPVNNLVGMPEHIALAVINGEHFDQSLKDWAWNSIDH